MFAEGFNNEQRAEAAEAGRCRVMNSAPCSRACDEFKPQPTCCPDVVMKLKHNSDVYCLISMFALDLILCTELKGCIR